MEWYFSKFWKLILDFNSHTDYVHSPKYFIQRLYFVQINLCWYFVSTRIERYDMQKIAKKITSKSH